MKGSIADMPLVIVVMVALSITIFAIYMIMGGLHERFSAVPELNETYLEKGMNAMEIFNTGFIMIFVVFYIVLGVMGYFLRTHPIFLVPSLMVLFLMIWVSGPIANTFLEIADEPVFAETVTEFGIIIFIFQNFPLFNLVFGTLVIILTFAIPRTEEGVYI